MGQLVYNKGDDITPQFLEETVKISSSKKITRVLEQPESISLLYNDDGYRGINRNFEFIPNRVFIDSRKKVIYSDFINFKLEYFKYIMPKIKTVFPEITNYINDEKIESVKLKPCHIVTINNMTKIAVGMKDVQDIQEVLLDPKNTPYIDAFVIAEIIRKFYSGENDFIDGFLIHKSILKYVIAILEEEVNCEYILNKLIDNPDIVNNKDFFKGTDDKQQFTILKNDVFKTTKIEPYLKCLDLKYLSALDVMGNVLNDKRFGRRE